MSISKGVVGIKDRTTGYEVTIDASGRMAVATPTPTPPPDTEAVNIGDIVIPGKNGGYIDIDYLIPNGYTLVLQRFNGGTEATLGKIAIYYDPNGNGVGMTLIKVAYLNVNNFQCDLSNEYIGNGIAKIKMRSTNNTSLNSKEFAMFFDGYKFISA